MTADKGHSEWSGQPPDPDPHQDLEYELDCWDVTDTRCRGEEHLVFLPSAERINRDAEFIVAHPDDVCDLCETL